MRGTDRTTRPSSINCRIIPAHAGNSSGDEEMRRLCRDHPRTCGEQPSHGPTPAISMGSSPHMRGTADPLDPVQSPIRIIPAHAGNSRWFGKGQNDLKDHPRTCGEQRLLRPLPWTGYGSSPHMRGTAGGESLYGEDHGIIPAHAGNSVRPARISRRIKDHPRTCGEQPTVAKTLS